MYWWHELSQVTSLVCEKCNVLLLIIGLACTTTETPIVWLYSRMYSYVVRLERLMYERMIQQCCP